MKVIGIIRSIGERTEDFSKHLLEKQLNEVFLVKNIIPMKNMTLECLNIGINSKADYIITCDADVFILPNMVEFMINKMKKHNSPLITGHTKSKFFGKREGGIRIWNSSFLHKIKDILNNNINDKLRPEAFIHTNIKGLLIDKITSYHEYEQYYVDIYNKFVNQSIKSRDRAYIIKKFKNNSDIDFKVAYHGFFDKEKNFRKSFPNLSEKNTMNVKDIEKYINI